MIAKIDTTEPLVETRYESVARYLAAAKAGKSKSELASLMMGRTIAKHVRYLDSQSVADLHAFIDAVKVDPSVGEVLCHVD